VGAASQSGAESKKDRAHDRLSSLPIGIGIPLPDRVTAERIAQNHRGPSIVVR
jgi:hypothetical protein